MYNSFSSEEIIIFDNEVINLGQIAGIQKKPTSQNVCTIFFKGGGQMESGYYSQIVKALSKGA